MPFTCTDLKKQIQTPVSFPPYCFDCRSADKPVSTNQGHMGGTCADCGDAAQLQLGLFVDEFCQALSQLIQVADFDVQNVDDTFDLDLCLILLLPAGGQCLFCTLDSIL